jgi:hypothetical protein
MIGSTLLWEIPWGWLIGIYIVLITFVLGALRLLLQHGSANLRRSRLTPEFKELSHRTQVLLNAISCFVVAAGAAAVLVASGIDRWSTSRGAYLGIAVIAVFFFVAFVTGVARWRKMGRNGRK